MGLLNAYKLMYFDGMILKGNEVFVWLNLRFKVLNKNIKSGNLCTLTKLEKHFGF